MAKKPLSVWAKVSSTPRLAVEPAAAGAAAGDVDVAKDCDGWRDDIIRSLRDVDEEAAAAEEASEEAEDVLAPALAPLIPTPPVSANTRIT